MSSQSTTVTGETFLDHMQRLRYVTKTLLTYSLRELTDERSMRICLGYWREEHLIAPSWGSRTRLGRADAHIVRTGSAL